jgi:hypothetical protein
LDVIRDYVTLGNGNKREILYNKFLSTKSKEYVTKDEFLKYLFSDSIKSNVKLIKTTITPFPVDLNNPTYRRFKIEEKKIVNSDTINDLYYKSLVNENGQWKIIWTGTLEVFAYEKYNKADYSSAR